MKIVMFIQRLAVRGIRQVKYLSKLGHDVHVFANRFPECLSDVNLPGRARIHRVGPNRPITSRSLQFAFRSFLQALKKIEIDIVAIGNDPSQRVSVLIASLQRALGVPVVVDMSEHIVEDCIARGMGQFKAFEEKMCELLLYKLAKRIFVVSKLKKETLPQDFQNKSVYIPNAADVDLYERRNLEKEAVRIRTKLNADHVLLYEEPIAGEQVERIRLMLDSFSRLLKEKRSAEIKLLLVGKANVSLRKTIQMKHLEKYIYLAGEIGYDHVPAYVKAADTGLAPYEKNFLRDMALGNKIFDYWCASKPIVITPVKSMALIAQRHDAGIVVQANEKSMANGMLRLIEDPSYAKKLGSNGRKLVEDFFNWNVQAKRMLKVYLECLSG